MKTTITAGSAILILCLSMGAFAQENPCGIAISRQLPSNYTPGATVEIQLTVTAGESCDIRAMGLLETVPGGWLFASMNPVDGTAPQISPAAGDSGTLEFAWFTIPTLPCTFAYTLNVPAEAQEQQTFTGHVEYRLSGGALESENAVSTIEEPSVEGQTEGQAEGQVEGEGEGQAEGEGEGSNPVNMQFVRHFAVTHYTPGEPLEVTITMSASTPQGLTAIGHYETLPPGWVFNELHGISGSPPVISPEAGDMGVLEFAWIQIPEIPYTFAYTITPPETADGPAVISGQIEYRTNSGAQHSSPVISEIDSQEGQAEGEGEGESTEGEEHNPLGISFQQHTAVTAYSPGEAMDVTITINAATAEELRAMGLYQTLPIGWVFNGMRAISGDLPIVAPAPGTMNYLEFAWITMPVFPYVFAYSVTPPENICAPVQFHGRVEYRTTGPAHYTPTVITRLNGPGCESAEVMCPIALLLNNHFDLADANSDGFLSLHEASEIIHRLTTSQFVELDADQNALLSPYELSAYLYEHTPTHGCLGGNSIYVTLWETIKGALGDFILFILLIISFIFGYRLV